MQFSDAYQISLEPSGLLLVLTHIIQKVAKLVSLGNAENIRTGMMEPSLCPIYSLSSRPEKKAVTE